MAHYKASLIYDAYRVFNGHFPSNFVICEYKHFGFNRKAFEKAGRDIEAARKRDIINKFKWSNLTNGE